MTLEPVANSDSVFVRWEDPNGLCTVSGDNCTVTINSSDMSTPSPVFAYDRYRIYLYHPWGEPNNNGIGSGTGNVKSTDGNLDWDS